MKRYIMLLMFMNTSSCETNDLSGHVQNTNGIYKTALKFSETKQWFYNASYQKIPYPNGDVSNGGACTDVVIRVLRANGIDLQKEVHEDMKAHFNLYPQRWGLSKPDPNIDHRRVPNLMTYFSRKGYTITNGKFQAGDIVCWDLGGLTHIGIYLHDEAVYHNIGPYARIEEDFLYKYKIIGHYRIFKTTKY